MISIQAHFSWHFTKNGEGKAFWEAVRVSEKAEEVEKQEKEEKPQK